MSANFVISLVNQAGSIRFMDRIIFFCKLSFHHRFIFLLILKKKLEKVDLVITDTPAFQIFIQKPF